MRKNKNTKSSIKRRFSAVSFTVITICVAIFSVVQFYLMDEIFAFATKVSLLAAANDISEFDFESNDYLPVLSDYEASRGIYIEVYSENDTLIYTTEGNDYVYNPEVHSNQPLTPRYMKILTHSDRSDGSYFELREEIYATAQYIVYGSFFGDNNSLQIYYPIDTITKNAETASWTLFILSIIALLLYYAGTYFFVMEFSKPVVTINSTAKKIANLDFSQNCPSFRITELDELSKSVNTLSASLEKALNKLKNENLQLEYDIKKERALEKTRRSFVANASHELKTPISIIHGYAEGMKYGIGCDSTEEFCDIIIDEAEKMNQLIVKLLEFLHIGSGEYPLSMQRFYLDELLMSHLGSLEPLYREKGITLSTDFGTNLYAEGDPTLLKIVFNNYVSNAISHAENEKEIHISVTEENDEYTVHVFNTGKCIPENDIANIWQSFYRADKSHSRAEGRFGLGLSIVASIQELHREDYSVENKENGVEFCFTVKKAERSQS